MKQTAVDKALDILDRLIDHADGLRAVDLAAGTGFPPGTLHRLLATLVAHDFVRHDRATGRYHLGHKFIQALQVMLRATGLQQRALPRLKELAQATGQAAHLGVLRGDHMVFLESIIADSAGPVMYTPPGTMAPPHCTALGKVMLAGLPAAELDQYVRRLSPLPASTPHSLVAPAALANEVARIQRQGYAVDREEYHPGVRCVAAPVRDHTGRIIAALSVSSPVAQMPDSRISAVAALVASAAEGMSRDLGYTARVQVDGVVPIGTG